MASVRYIKRIDDRIAAVWEFLGEKPMDDLSSIIRSYLDTTYRVCGLLFLWMELSLSCKGIKKI